MEETGQLANTVIIFTSDNGYAWGQHGFRLKIAPYDANLLTPLIVYQPEIFPKGEVCNCPVNGVDIIRTIHSLCNVTPKNKLDGNDLSHLLKNPRSKKWDNTPMIQLYTGSLYGNISLTQELNNAYETGNWDKFIVHKTGIRAWMMMRKGQYKYIRYIYHDYIEELYDMQNDPEELTNLAVDNNYHDILNKYRNETIELFKKRGATFTHLLPEPKIINRIQTGKIMIK